MSDPTPRRRMAGRALLGAGLLVLPLTASISYAANEAALEAPEAPEAPEPPAPPSPPGGPDAPLPPPPPPPPGMILIDTRTGTVTTGGDGDSEVTEQVWRDADGKENRVRMVFRGGPGGPAGPDPEVTERRIKALRSDNKAEREAAIAEMRAEAEAQRARREAWRAMAGRMDGDAARPPMPPMPPMPPRVMVVSGCTPGERDMVETRDGKDGKQIITICKSRIDATARAGLESAREEIAKDSSIPEETRQRVLQTLDAQIARLRAKVD